MVVNPQTFNYRLIIGTLIIAMFGLGAYSFSSYNELNSQRQFLSQEKKIVESELSKIITRYDELMSENEDMREELAIAKEKTIKLLDSLKVQEATIHILSKYRKQISALQDERNNFMAIASSLKQENKQLVQERKLVSKRLVEQTDFNNQLSEKNQLLAENLKKGSVLTANSFGAKAFKIKSSGKIIETDKAKRTDFMEICFTLAENYLVEEGDKDFYIQILNPNNNVIGDKLSKRFGENTLIYTAKTTRAYNKQVLDVCVKTKTTEDENVFVKGTYFVTVFNDNKKIGSTSIDLN